MTPLTLKTAIATRGHTQALKDGTIVPEGFALDFEEVPVIINAFRRMVRGLEFDVCELAVTTYVCARAHGMRFTAIPVFPMRAFHHGAVVCNVTSGIEAPKDLEGRRVGVHRGYTVTTGVWARGILQHHYGVDLERITWVLSGDEHVAEWRPPSNVVPMDGGPGMEQRLVSGQIPAAINVQVDSPNVKPLFPDASAVAFDALRTRGLYPINHTVVVRDELLERNPDLAPALFRAFAEAKRLYMGALDDALLLQVSDIIGDPLPYGLEPNRRMLETLVQYAFEQKIIPRRVAVEELFPASTHALIG
jgi:4,5-dihydroxyphthalate decarboxylase